MRILLITDQSPDSDHSAIMGIFNRHLRNHAEVRIVWFSRETELPIHKPGQSTLPWRYRKLPFLWRISPPCRLDNFDVIIVRNLFGTLGELARDNRTYLLGFWESFPHSYRRLHEAMLTGRALWRKKIEYVVRQYRERKLLSHIDFYLPITETYRQHFRADVALPYHSLPMGVDPENLPLAITGNPTRNGKLKLIYVGAIDALRGFNILIPALLGSKVEFELDIYTASRNVATTFIIDTAASYVRIHGAVSRRELLYRMADYDLGIALIPANPLYDVASPTKTMEYYAMGLPVLMTPLPEHLALFDRDSGFFCPLSKEGIITQLLTIQSLDREVLIQMGLRGRQTVLAKRSYEVLAKDLHSFLKQIQRTSLIH